MDVFVVSPSLSFINCTFPYESTVRDLLELFSTRKGVASLDFYVKKNGRLSGGEERLQSGAVYRLEPRLCGGKGGFGSMLRALGAQIEKTTNREACRDLSGRRLRDVNHEKEMAEWLKKQTDRDAEKEQRRLEKIRRKLANPKRSFIDAEFDQQCHDLSERLEDSVLKGMQASSSSMVQAEDKPCRKRPANEASATSSKKNCFWTGFEGVEDMESTDEDSDESEADDVASSHSASSSGTSSASTSVAGPSSISQPATVLTSMAGEQKKAESQDQPCSSSSSCSSASSAPCSPPPSQETSEEKEERRETEQKEKENAQSTSDGEKVENDRSVESIDPQKVQPEDADTLLDLLSVSKAEELEAVGLERLKIELMKRGMKCGGTLQERAARLFSIRGLKADEINPVLLAKPSKGKKK